MKTLLLAVSFLVSSVSFAGEFTTYQSIIFQSASSFVPANKVCQSGNHLYHVSRSTIDALYCDDEGRNCVADARPLKQPVVSTAQKCAQFNGPDDGCSKWVSYTLKQGPVVKTYTYRSQKDWEDGKHYVSQGTYKIPACH